MNCVMKSLYTGTTTTATLTLTLYTGVKMPNGNRYCAVLYVEGKNKHLGTFGIAEEAALAYAKAYLQEYGGPPTSTPTAKLPEPAAVLKERNAAIVAERKARPKRNASEKAAMVVHTMALDELREAELQNNLGSQNRYQ